MQMHDRSEYVWWAEGCKYWL